MDSETAYEEGYGAYWEDLSLEDNPYKKTTGQKQNNAFLSKKLCLILGLLQRIIEN